MSVVALVVLAVVVIGAAWTARGVSTVLGQRLAVGRLAARVGLVVPEHLDAELRRRVAARARWGCLGAVLGAGAGVVAALGLSVGPDPVLDLVAGGAAAGGILAVCLVVLAQAARRPGAENTRMARARRTTLADYLPASQRWGAPVVGTASLAALAVSLARVPGGWRAVVSDHPALLAVPVAATLVAAVLAAVLTVTVLRSPQPAASAAGLAWDDALRWRSLDDLLFLPVLVAFVTGSASLAVLETTVDGPMTGTPLLLLLILFALITWGARPERHLGRLWADTPEVAARAGR